MSAGWKGGAAVAPNADPPCACGARVTYRGLTAVSCANTPDKCQWGEGQPPVSSGNRLAGWRARVRYLAGHQVFCWDPGCCKWVAVQAGSWDDAWTDGPFYWSASRDEPAPC